MYVFIYCIYFYLYIYIYICVSTGFVGSCVSTVCQWIRSGHQQKTCFLFPFGKGIESQLWIWKSTCEVLWTRHDRKSQWISESFEMTLTVFFRFSFDFGKTWWLKATFLSPRWRSLNHLQGHEKPPQKGHQQNCQEFIPSSEYLHICANFSNSQKPKALVRLFENSAWWYGVGVYYLTPLENLGDPKFQQIFLFTWSHRHLVSWTHGKLENSSWSDGFPKKTRKQRLYIKPSRTRDSLFQCPFVVLKEAWNWEQNVGHVHVSVQLRGW